MKAIIVFLAVVALCMASPAQLRTDDEIAAVDFITGFLEGLHENKTTEDLLKCIKSFEPIFNEIKEALAYFKKFNFNNIVKGVTLLIKAVKEIVEALKPCMEGFQQLKKLVDVIKSASPSKIAMKILANPIAIIADVTACIEGFKSKDYKAAGKALGDIMYRLFLATENLGDNKVIDFLRGFLEGLNEKGNVNDLLKCVKDIESILVKVQQAMEYIKKNNTMDLIRGITMLIEAVSALLNTIRPCAEGFEQIKKLFDAIGHIDIIKLVFKVLSEPSRYIEDVKKCINGFNTGDFYTAGKCLGDFLYGLLLSSAAAMKDEITVDEVIAIVSGFLDGVNQGGSFANIKECFDSVPDAIKDVENAVEVVQTIDWASLDNVLVSFMTLSDTFHKILATIRPCSKVGIDFEAIIEKLENLDATEILNKMLKSSMQIIHYITNSVKAWSNQDYSGFGKNIGDVFYLILFATEA